MKLTLSALVLLFSLNSFASVDVVYGDDNRLDIYASNNQFYVDLSVSTAAMINSSNLTVLRDEVKINGRTLEARGMCASERFSHQTTAASCSGFLVGPDLLVTAGHCIETMSDCRKYDWVFDYKVENDTQSSVTVHKNKVYKCKKIISQSLDRRTKDDYALIKLDRKVTDRQPLKYRRSGKIKKGTEIVVIGHPSGLPAKIADGAKVRKTNNVFFQANLDTYGGNSGSAVFNAQTGEVEGILVRGEQDYKYNSSKGCYETNYLSDNGGRGEDVTLITNIKELN
jgi:V8-like Glu-specific endopeptidase